MAHYSDRTAATAARVASYREDWTGAEMDGNAGLSDAEIATLLLARDAEAAALAERDQQEENVRLAALGLTRGQIVRAGGAGAHYDSHGAKVVALDGIDWRVSGFDSDGRVVLSSVQPDGHYALVRPEQIAR